MPLVHEIQSQLLRDLFASFMTAFVLIAIVMTIVQAGVLSGLLSMVPNVFPALALFGILGWMNHPIDIGSIMTASVAMGIAVDDSIHYFSRFNTESRRLANEELGVERAISLLRGEGYVDAAASELHRARKQLGELTGDGAPDEVLDSIFAEFCIGK